MSDWLVQYQAQLSDQISNESLPHALLVTGVAGAGKGELTHWLSQLLVCMQPVVRPNNGVLSACGQCKACLLFSKQNYPDHYLLEPDGRTLGVDEIRKANHFLEKTAMIGKFKTVVIKDADKMTVAAANALLKTLEEPSANSVIILIAVDSGMLLPTIVSRCRVINIRPPVGKQLLAQLGASGQSTYANLSHLPELTDTGLAQQYEEIEKAFIEYLHKEQSYTQLLALLTDSEYALRWLEKITVNLSRQKQHWLEGESPEPVKNLAGKAALSTAGLWQIYQSILNCSKQQKTLSQVNADFALEKLLIDIRHLVSIEGE